MMTMNSTRTIKNTNSIRLRDNQLCTDRISILVTQHKKGKSMLNNTCRVIQLQHHVLPYIGKLEGLSNQVERTR